MPLNFVSYYPAHYSLTHPDTGEEMPALVTAGCGCCSNALPLTQTNLDAARKEAEEWLETLRGLKPFDYPEGMDE